MLEKHGQLSSVPTGNATLCISIAARPSRFGITVHNAGYRALNLDFFYRAFCVNNIEGVISGIRALGIRGCSVSMPFKEAVIPYLDRLDPHANFIGAVNTIVNDNNQLVGYNTDAMGVRDALLPHLNDYFEPVLVLGSGGAARAVLKALNDLNIKKIILCGRNAYMTQIVANQFNTDYIKWSERNEVKAKILINATPVGMLPDSAQMPINENLISQYKLIVDMVAMPLRTRLIHLSQIYGITTVSGFDIALHQAYAQFFLYTGHEAPRQSMFIAAQTLYKEVGYV